MRVADAGSSRHSSTVRSMTSAPGTSPCRRRWASVRASALLLESVRTLLANRTYDDGPNRMQTLRRTVHDRVADAARPEFTGSAVGG